MGMSALMTKSLRGDKDSSQVHWAVVSRDRERRTGGMTLKENLDCRTDPDVDSDPAVRRDAWRCRPLDRKR